MTNKERKREARARESVRVSSEEKKAPALRMAEHLTKLSLIQIDKKLKKFLRFHERLIAEFNKWKSETPLDVEQWPDLPRERLLIVMSAMCVNELHRRKVPVPEFLLGRLKDRVTIHGQESCPVEGRGQAVPEV